MLGRLISLMSLVRRGVGRCVRVLLGPLIRLYGIVLVSVRKIIFRVVTSNSVGGRWGRFIGLDDLCSAGCCSRYGGTLHCLVGRLEILADLISGSWYVRRFIRF